MRELVFGLHVTTHRIYVDGMKRHILMVDMGDECDVTDVRQEGDLARKSGSGGCVTDKGRQRVALVENTKEHTRNKTNSALCKRDGPGSRRCVDNVQLIVGLLGRGRKEQSAQTTSGV